MCGARGLTSSYGGAIFADGELHRVDCEGDHIRETWKSNGTSRWTPADHFSPEGFVEPLASRQQQLHHTICRRVR
jgi:hypothetical protein